MKKRVISAIIIAIITIPVLYFGGIYYKFGISLLTVLGYTEFLMTRDKTHKMPDLMKIIAYLSLFILFLNFIINKETFSIDFRYIFVSILLFLVPIILYHDDNLYNTDDAFYLIGGTIFLSCAFGSLYYIRGDGIEPILYLLTITIASDTFAYFTGSLIGKHKMIPSISPKKTWEGMIGGTVMSVALGTIFYMNFMNETKSLVMVILITLFLSIISQFGDLIFSAVKRHAKIKDFSNIIPGHGGILDRLDSLILIILAYMLVIL